MSVNILATFCTFTRSQTSPIHQGIKNFTMKTFLYAVTYLLFLIFLGCLAFEAGKSNYTPLQKRDISIIQKGTKIDFYHPFQIDTANLRDALVYIHTKDDSIPVVCSATHKLELVAWLQFHPTVYLKTHIDSAHQYILDDIQYSQ